MVDLVGDEQASFIPGCHTTNNIVISQEFPHSLTRKTGKVVAMIAKIDLEKAYDRVNWSFLESVITVVGFGCAMINVILGCLKPTRLSILWNGEQLDSFILERGLGQRDPLSPYLFVLCMETLGHKIQATVLDG